MSARRPQGRSASSSTGPCLHLAGRFPQCRGDLLRRGPGLDGGEHPLVNELGQSIGFGAAPWPLASALSDARRPYGPQHRPDPAGGRLPHDPQKYESPGWRHEARGHSTTRESVDCHWSVLPSRRGSTSPLPAADPRLVHGPPARRRRPAVPARTERRLEAPDHAARARSAVDGARGDVRKGRPGRSQHCVAVQGGACAVTRTPPEQVLR